MQPTIASVLTPMIHYPTCTPVIVEIKDVAIALPTEWKTFKDEDGELVFVLVVDNVVPKEELDGTG